jgi:hypothetical protein
LRYAQVPGKGGAGGLVWRSTRHEWGGGYGLVSAEPKNYDSINDNGYHLSGSMLTVSNLSASHRSIQALQNIFVGAKSASYAEFFC